MWPDDLALCAVTRFGQARIGATLTYTKYAGVNHSVEFKTSDGVDTNYWEGHTGCNTLFVGAAWAQRI